ncbi:hypothetical protein C8R44DRAFT_394107 [Mycena epipterygia]|nr:hypothetical protein C8R44DRAFT_394107 [Mycena epipterygia]
MTNSGQWCPATLIIKPCFHIGGTSPSSHLGAMSAEISVRCTLTDHEQVLETVKFPPGIYRGFDFVADLQKSHDVRCHCATRIHRVYKVERRQFAVYDSEEEEEELPIETSLIDPFDFMSEHFPTQPYKVIVNILCDAAPPLSPISSPSSNSAGSNLKRSRSSQNDSSSNCEHKQKRARTRPFSPISLTSSSRRASNSFDRLEPPYPSFDFSDSLTQPDIAFIDKTQCLLELPDRF